MSGPEWIAHCLEYAGMIDDWISDIRKRALKMALDGERIPRFKLVEGMSRRKYADDAAVIAAVEAEGLADKAVRRTPVGLTEMTKILGKQRFDALIGPHVIKPPGKPSLVPEDDARPEMAIDSAIRAELDGE